MDLQSLVTRFLRYNAWANERICSWLLTIDRSILYQETGSSFGTIDRTFQHILNAQKYWYEIIVNNTIDTSDEPIRHDEVEKVMADVVTSAKDLERSISGMDEHQLTESIRASDSMQARYEYILHVVNHSSYHRGQVVTMCRALGVTGEIPVTDYDAYLWWIENPGVREKS